MNPKVYIERQFAAIFAAKNSCRETQIPMDDVQEMSKLDALLSQRSGASKGVSQR